MAKVKLKDGCPGCSRLWRDNGSEGQCSRCKRCLSCCGRASVPFSCDDRFARRAMADPGYASRSAAAYERWQANPNILKGNRRIF